MNSVNYKQLAEDFNLKHKTKENCVPKNGGQIMKAILVNAGVDLEHLETASNSGTRIRRMKRR